MRLAMTLIASDYAKNHHIVAIVLERLELAISEKNLDILQAFNR